MIREDAWIGTVGRQLFALPSFLSALSPFLVPLVSQLWVRALGERVVYSVGWFIVFFGVAYLVFAIVAWLLLQTRTWPNEAPTYASVAVGYLFLPLFLLQFCIDLTMNPGSTGAIGFIFLLPAAVVVTLVGGMAGTFVGVVFAFVGMTKKLRLTQGLSISVIAAISFV